MILLYPFVPPPDTSCLLILVFLNLSVIWPPLLFSLSFPLFSLKTCLHYNFTFFQGKGFTLKGHLLFSLQLLSSLLCFTRSSYISYLQHFAFVLWILLRLQRQFQDQKQLVSIRVMDLEMIYKAKARHIETSKQRCGVSCDVVYFFCNSHRFVILSHIFLFCFKWLWSSNSQEKFPRDIAYSPWKL